MRLETERLILRPWTEADAEECYKYARDPRVGPIAGWPVHTSVENSRQVIRDVLMVPETYAIVLKETGLPIGSIGLHHNDLAEKDDESELGYWLGVPFWGRGIVPEAARELLRHAFEDLGLKRVWCAYYDGNNKSKRVQEKLGFRYQWTTENAPVPQLGETRKGHVNLLTKEEWLAAGSSGKENLLIRKLRDDESELLRDFLYEAIFIPEGVEPPDRSIIHAPELAVYYEGFGNGPADNCLVAEVNGKTVGAVWTRIMNDYGHVDDDTPSFAISLFADYRGKGIGTCMMCRMLELLRNQGWKKASLAVQKANYAVRMYQAVGFNTVDESTEEYIMVCEL